MTRLSKFEPLGLPKLSSGLRQNVPEFIRVEHPMFVAFLEAYFEWLESEYSDYSPADIKHVDDVDLSLDAFADFFRQQYIFNFPKNLAEDTITGPLDQRRFIKNIKEFYRTKGTPKSFDFFFKALFNSEAELYLPETDILRASDGNWVVQKSIRTTNNLGTDLFKAKNKVITQFNTETQENIATARVERLVFYKIGNFDVAELFLSDIQGTFLAGFPISFSTDEITKPLLESYTYPVVASIDIISGGLGHSTGESVEITGGNGTGAEAIISRTGPNGEAISIDITNFGANYTNGASVGLSFTKTQEEIDAGITGIIASATTGALCVYPGFYSNEDGKLSSNKVMQDNIFYQNFSYVIQTEIVIERYKDVVKNLIHPAGWGFFGSIQIKRCLETELANTASLIQYEIPLIGHYVPYTLNTTENLADVYPNGYPTGGIEGNPLVSTPGDPDSDPFWIIFDHPNTRGFSDIPAGISFGQIVLRSFFNMPTGYTFSCSTDG